MSEICRVCVIDTFIFLFSFLQYESESVSHSVVSDSLRPHGLKLTRPLCPWSSPGKNTGVGCHALVQRIFLIQELNPGLLQCRQILPTESPGKPYRLTRSCKNSTERVHGSLDLLAGLPAPGTPQGCNTLSRPGRAHGVTGGRRAV